MVMSTGVDGCRIGWFCVSRDQEQSLVYSVVPSLEGLMATNVGQTIAIDIPIGLPAAGDRDVDQTARRMVGPRRSSVFPVPIRQTIGAENREEATAIGRQVDGRGVGVQSWAIVPKIVELDEILQRNRNLLTSVHECHPEVCWTALNYGAPMQYGKKSSAGRLERLALLQNQFGEEGVTVFEAAKQRFRRCEVAIDDILDAFACLWTAERVESGWAVGLLPNPPIDSVGIPMQMVF